MSNEHHIEKFLDNCIAEGLGEARIKKYRFILINLSKMLGKDFDKATKDDIQALVIKIEKSSYADWTKSDYKVTIKKFYKWLKGNSEFYPDEVRWIKAKLKNHKKKLPEELLTEDDIKKLIEASTNIRDKALISVLYESGCRIGEILGLKLKHVKFDQYGAVLMVSGKTGDRRVRLVNAVPHLSLWVQNHPEKDNSDAYLWVSIGTLNHNEQVSYQCINKMLKLTANKIHLQNKVNPHIFRHSRATFLANHLTEAQMKEQFGWVQGSDMASTYVHLSGRDIDDAILHINNIKEAEHEKPKTILTPKTCSRCKFVNPATSKYCNQCSMALDIESALSVEDKMQDLASLITPEILEKLIEKKVEQMLKNVKFKD